MVEKEGICCLCGKEYNDYGHNPVPVCVIDEARCCNVCNANIVIPARKVGVNGY